MTKRISTFLAFIVGAAVAGIVAACVPGQTPGQTAKTVIKDIVDDGEKTCVVVQDLNISATATTVCALVDDWGPLVDHVLARKAARLAAEKAKAAQVDGGH